MTPNPEDEYELDGVEIQDEQPVLRRFRVTLNGGLQSVYLAHFYDTDNAGTLTFITQDEKGRYWHRISINGHSWQEVAELLPVAPEVPAALGLITKNTPVH